MEAPDIGRYPPKTNFGVARNELVLAIFYCGATKIADMRVKLKYGLPLAQMASALTLLWWGDSWQRAMMRIQDMPGPSPAFTLLVSINAPVGLARAFWLRAFWFRYLPDTWDWATLIVAVGGLWYLVALNINSWREQRSVFMFSSAPLRVAGDLLLIAVGAGLGAGLALVRVSSQPQFALWPNWLWFMTIKGLWLAWCVVLIFPFSRDLFFCVLRIRDNCR